MTFRSALTGFAAGVGLAMAGGSAAFAQAVPWQLGFQPAASPVMDQIARFHDFLLIMITAITLFVLALLLYVMYRFNARRNPMPSTTTHNTVIEVLWTVIPILILVLMAVPSFKLLYFGDRAANPEMTLKAIGQQWYWTYEYPDHGNFTFDAVMVADSDIKPGQLRLLETDNSVVLPVNTDIRILVTASDVIHAWAIPAFGVKMDGYPGKLNETWVRIEKEGVYYGQCSELCGTNHGFMPIRVEAVSKEKFAAWTKDAQKKFAKADQPAATPVRLAAEAVR
ncbi:MAG: cytochrome c oxidase subunit II [Alphaproteobacteria bacterium]|nr:cytochrome c oxidase subunit II [Alphaproteobacteria bacterium]